jgi:integrase
MAATLRAAEQLGEPADTARAFHVLGTSMVLRPPLAGRTAQVVTMLKLMPVSTSEPARFTERRDTALIRLLIDTGIRSSELLGLTVTDLDFEQDVALVLGKGLPDSTVCVVAALVSGRHHKIRPGQDNFSIPRPSPLQLLYRILSCSHLVSHAW